MGSNFDIEKINSRMEQILKEQNCFFSDITTSNPEKRFLLLFRKAVTLDLPRENLEELNAVKYILENTHSEFHEKLRPAAEKTLKLANEKLRKHFPEPLTLSEAESKAMGENFFSAKYQFTKASGNLANEKMTIDPAKLALEIPGNRISTDLKASLIGEILISMKEGREPDFTFLNGNTQGVLGLFDIIDYFCLDDFQNKYLEPFNKKFPDFPLENSPKRIKRLDLTLVEAAALLRGLRNLIKFHNIAVTISNPGFLKRLPPEEINALPNRVKQTFKTLDLSDYDARGIDFSLFPSVTELILSGSKNLRSGQINNLPSEFKAPIEKLDLSSSRVKNIRLSGFLNLRDLNLDSTGYYALNTIEPLISGENKLAKLNLSCSPGSGLNRLRNTHLNTLILRSCPALTANEFNSIPSEIKASIRTLDLSYCINLEGFDLSEYTSLTHLILESTGSSTPEWFGDIPLQIKRNLTKLNCSHSFVGEMNLALCSNLTELSLEGSKGFREILMPAAVKRNLTKLDLSDCDITGERLSDYENVSELILNGATGFTINQFNDIPIERKGKITILDFGGLDVTGLHLSDCILLKKLILAHAIGVDCNLINNLPESAKNTVTTLDLTFCPVNGIKLPEFTRIEELILDHTEGLTARQFKEMPSSAKKTMRKLSLTYCSLPGAAFLSDFKNLKELGLKGAYGFTGEEMRSVAKKLTEVSALHLSFSNIDGIPLKLFKNLETVTVTPPFP